MTSLFAALVLTGGVVFTAVVTALTLAAITPASVTAQTATDILRGRVTSSGVAVPNARVTVMDKETQTSRTSITNDDGRYTVLFPDGSGDYVITVNAIGFMPATKAAAMLVGDQILVTDITMERQSLARLDSITIQAGRPQAQPGVDRSAGASEQAVGLDALRSVLSLDNGQGDLLSRLAATLPGVTLVPGTNGEAPGFSVLGLSPAQNSVTLDGNTSSGTLIPRDAIGQVSLATTTYDPSRGNFSGGQLSVSTRSGSNVPTRSLSITTAEPTLTFADKATRAFQPPQSNRQINASMGGAIVPNKVLYFGSIQVARQASDATTLLDAGSETFRRAGVSGDSVTRLVDVMHSYGIPVTTGAIPDDRVNTTTSSLLRFDLPRSGTSSITVTLMASLANQSGSGLTPLATPARAGKSVRSSTRLQSGFSNYFGDGFLNEFRGSIEHSATRGTPYVLLPDGSVRIGSTLADGTPSISSLLFGGASGMDRSSSTSTWELRDEISWISFNNKHQYKLSFELQNNRQRSANNSPLGSYIYNSLADFEANLPASFTRTFLSTNNVAGSTSFAASLGDSWRVNDQLRIQYGVRADMSWVSGRPAYNPAVDSVFGVRNDYVPTGFGLSPRLGFTYSLRTPERMTRAEQRRQMDQMAQRTGGRGMNAGMFRTSPVLRGGIGLFRSALGSGLVTSAANATGLPGGLSQLTCIGAAVPPAMWGAFAGHPELVPTQCLDGTGPEFLGATQPNVVLLVPGIRPPTSLRSNLGWQGVISRWNVNVEGTYSLNFNQSDITDLNFLGVPQFAMTSEGGRPVYVNANAIVPGTGAISPVDGRRSADFGTVSANASGIKSETKQLTVQLSPAQMFSRWGSYSLGYTYTNTREQSRGFMGNTSGDPRVATWGPGSAPRHQLTLNLFSFVKGHLNTSLVGRVSSGSRFTPMIAGDVNGDGRSNDRAYIVTPTDPVLGSAMQSLLDASPQAIRECLAKQSNRIAARNSCTTPWSATADAFVSLVFQPQLLGPTHGGTQLSIQFVNPLSGLDQLFGGALHTETWNRAAYSDPTLFYVRGFDPATQRFLYDVNPRFGTARNLSTRVRQPFGIRLDFTISYTNNDAAYRRSLLGEGFGGRPNQETGAQAGPRSSSSYSASELRARYVQRTPNPYAVAARMDSVLALSPVTKATLSTLSNAFTAKVDTLWVPFSTHVTERPDFDVGAALKLTQTAFAGAYTLATEAIETLKTLLTPEQFAQLPQWIREPTPPAAPPKSMIGPGGAGNGRGQGGGMGGGRGGRGGWGGGGRSR